MLSIVLTINGSGFAYGNGVPGDKHPGVLLIGQAPPVAPLNVLVDILLFIGADLRQRLFAVLEAVDVGLSLQLDNLAIGVIRGLPGFNG